MNQLLFLKEQMQEVIVKLSLIYQVIHLLSHHFVIKRAASYLIDLFLEHFVLVSQVFIAFLVGFRQTTHHSVTIGMSLEVIAIS